MQVSIIGIIMGDSRHLVRLQLAKSVSDPDGCKRCLLALTWSYSVRRGVDMFRDLLQPTTKAARTLKYPEKGHWILSWFMVTDTLNRKRCSKPSTHGCGAYCILYRELLQLGWRTSVCWKK